MRDAGDGRRRARATVLLTVCAVVSRPTETARVACLPWRSFPSVFLFFAFLRLRSKPVLHRPRHTTKTDPLRRPRARRSRAGLRE